jgi:hypothetical protein
MDHLDGLDINLEGIKNEQMVLENNGSNVHIVGRSIPER